MTLSVSLARKCFDLISFSSQKCFFVLKQLTTSGFEISPLWGFLCQFVYCIVLLMFLQWSVILHMRPVWGWASDKDNCYLFTKFQCTFLTHGFVSHIILKKPAMRRWNMFIEQAFPIFHITSTFSALYHHNVIFIIHQLYI